MNEEIENYIHSSSDEIKKIIELIPSINDSINAIINSIKNKNKIVIFGNGGSAADAQHFAAELIGRYKIERESLPALALTTDTSILTSISNDYSFEVVFSRQCESLILENDIAIGISTSGNSKNIFEGLKTAKTKGAKTVALLGNSGGIIKTISDISIIVDSSITATIQESHRIIIHIICEIVEKEFSTIKN